MTRVEHARRHRTIEAMPSATAVLVAASALLVLIGWEYNVEFLKSLPHPDYSEMNPATAVAFLLSAAAQWIFRRDEFIARPAYRFAQLCAAGALMIAVGRLGAYAGLWHHRMDVLLFPSRLQGNVMAPNTAAAFALIAIALLTLHAPPWRRFHFAQLLVLATLAIAVLSIVGYLYDISELYGMRGAIPMALNSAILFLLLSVGLLCSRPAREPLATVLSRTTGGVVARRLLPAAFLLPLLVGGGILAGWKNDLYDPTFGMTLFVLAIIVLFNALVWWTARIIRVSDIRRQQTADELRLSEQRYHAIMRQTVEGIYLVDIDSYRIVETNLAMRKLLGYDEGELEGQPVFILVNDSHEHVVARLLHLKNAGLPLQGERQYKRKDGSLIDVYAGATVISYGGRSAACTILHDVTERNRAHALLQEKHDQLEHAIAAERAALEQLRLAQSQLVQSEKLASLGQMVAGVAHEINNPLSFVSNNVAVLQRDTHALCELLALYARADDVLAQHDPALLQEMRQAAERMDLAYTRSNLDGMMARSREGLRRIQQIVKDLRDFARLDESDLHEVDLNAGVESTVNIVVGRAKKKHVELKLDLHPLPLVSCYPAKINQVIMNLVANAIDACPEGGKVSVGTAPEDAGVRISVADNGPGVPAGIRGRIFDPFFTTKPQGEGTGLGLSISYGIVHDHGGEITVTDAPGGGALFTVTLPRHAPRGGGTSSEAAGPAPHDPAVVRA